MEQPLNERVAKLEVRLDQHEDYMVRLDKSIAKLDEDQQTLRKELGDKLDHVLAEALQTVPAWAAKKLDSNTKIIVTIIGAFVTILGFFLTKHG